MKRLVVALSFIVCLAAPEPAPAAIGLRFGEPNDGQAGIRRGTNYVDVLLTDPDPPEDERLIAYDLGIRLVMPEGVGQPSVRFLEGPGAAAVPPDRFVFPAPPSDFSVVRQAEDLLVAFVASDEGPADIETGDKALRLFFHFEPADPGNYRFEFDLQTVFASQDVQPIPLVFENSLTIPWIPEPAALALLAPAAVFAVRPARSRRRSCGDFRKV